jgi:hypothetical protein
MENMDQYKTPGQLVGALISKRGWTNRLVAAVLNRNGYQQNYFGYSTNDG